MQAKSQMPASQRREQNLLAYVADLKLECLGVGVSVVKVLVEQSGGFVTKRTDERYGTTVLAVLPRFGANDYLEDVQRSKTNSEN